MTPSATVIRRSSKQTTTIGLLMACLCLLLARPACAQPEERPPARQPQERLEISPERLRARLASLLEEIDASRARLNEAIETLDNGGTSDEAMQVLGGSARVRRMAEFWGQWARGGPEGRPGADRVARNNANGRNPERGGADRGPGPNDDVPVEDVSAFLESHAPEFAARLRQLRDEDPRRAEVLRNRLRPRVGEILAAMRMDPELGELLTREFRVSMEMLDVSRRYAQMLAASDPNLDEVRAELRSLAAEHVELRLARRDHEIKVLAARIDELQAEVDEQRANREVFIEQIVERAGRMGVPEGDRPGRRGPRGERPGEPDGN